MRLLATFGLCAALCASGAAAAAPPNDTCDAAIPIASLPATERANVAGATVDPDEPTDGCAAAASGSVWYTVAVPAAGTLVVATAGSDYDTVVDVYEGACSTLTLLDCNDDGAAFGLSSQVLVPVQGGETLRVRVTGLGATEPRDLVLTVVLDGPPNDTCATAIDVGVLPYLDERTTVGAASEDDGPAGGCGAIVGSVWYRFTPSDDGFVVADTAGSDFDTVLAAFAGGCDAPEAVGCTDDTGTLQADLGVPVTAGVPVLFEVGGFEGDLGVGALRFQVAWATPPANDTCEAPTPIASLPTSVEQVVTGATRDAFPESGCASGSASVWYDVVPPTGGVLTVDTVGSDYDTVLDAFAGGCDTPILLDCNDDEGGMVTSRIRFGVQAGERIRIAASAFEGGAGRTLVLNARHDPCVGDADCDRRDDTCATDACVGGACVFTPIPGCCMFDQDCDDADPCTTDRCADAVCESTSLAGLELAGCRLRDDAVSCGPDAMPDRLRVVIDRRLRRALDRRDRAAATARPGRARRLLRRADAQLRKAQRRLDRAARRERIDPGCAAALGAALTETLHGA